MTSKNDITGDKLVSKKTNKKFEEGFDKIKPSCYNTCSYQVDTLIKCKVCAWHPKREKNGNT
jgi:hypothetical protein